LVVEGDAIALAGRLRTEYGGRTKSHTRFGTAKWIVSPGDGLSLAHPVALDFVTARTEFYEHPAALPEVEASSLQHDLYRRDFTINTMAICLNQSRYGELVDFYGGKADLDRRLIRVLHNLSFIDDATRILRAARLAQRLGFAIEERTASLIADALGSLDRISGDRLRHELRLLFQETEPERTIKLLDELGVLRRLHPNLRYTPWLAGRYAALRGGLATWRSWGWGNGGRGGDEATAMLAAYASILAYWLSREELSQFMNRLNIAGEVGFVMRQVWEARATAVALANGAAPSQIYRLLKPYVIEAIVVMYITEPSQTVREAIASYVDELRHVRTEVDGLTLKSLGVAPGPLYSKLLQAVLDARLDGNVSNRAQEEYLLRRLLSAGPD
jgi:tRNA nucleotidyltransferase (CCA-adding enzyme)